MQILIIRHGDPNYALDTLTPKGIREAKLLASKISKMDVAAFYCSPLGRAKKTASYTLKKMNRTAEICDFLREFQALLTTLRRAQLTAGTDCPPIGLPLTITTAMTSGSVLT